MDLYGIWYIASSTLGFFIILMWSVMSLYDICVFIKAQKTNTYPKTTLDDLFDKHSFDKKKKRIILTHLILLIITLFASSHFVILLGCDDLRVMPDGKYGYYVEATDEKGNTYTLPAKVDKYQKHYGVENIYFNNGGYLYFETYDSFEYNKIGRAQDQNRNWWEFKLTNKKVPNTPFVESDIHQIQDYDYFYFVSALIFAISAIMHKSIYKKYKDKEDLRTT